MLALLAFIKSIPGMIAAAALAAVIGYIGYLKIENGSLETSLAKTQAAAAVLKQSNKSLELDNKKKQQEFQAAIIEQKNVTEHDQNLADQARVAREAADRLGKQQEKVKNTDPDSFIRDVNRDIGCDFQGFGKAMTCATVDESNPEPSVTK
jgi:hypothetical protein